MEGERGLGGRWQKSLVWSVEVVEVTNASSLQKDRCRHLELDDQEPAAPEQRNNNNPIPAPARKTNGCIYALCSCTVTLPPLTTSSDGWGCEEVEACG